MMPGEYILANESIEANIGRETEKIKVINNGDRPVQIGSHFHFFEVNKQMEFDRQKAIGMRLNIPAGTAVRFEPGEEKEVILVRFGGKKITVGFSNLVDGETVSAKAKKDAYAKAIDLHFKDKPQ